MELIVLLIKSGLCLHNCLAKKKHLFSQKNTHLWVYFVQIRTFYLTPFLINNVIKTQGFQGLLAQSRRYVGFDELFEATE